MNKKILLFDIETAPNLGYVWGKYDQNVIEFESEWYVLCFAYKWLGDKKTHSHGLPQYKLYAKEKDNDYEVIKKMHELFNEADIVIAHNGNKFDIKKINARFLYHGFNPPKPYAQIDTLLVARRYFAFTSNKLNDLAVLLKLGKKAETGGFELWKNCLYGVESAWTKMLKYCKQDVVLLEKVYLKLLPWIKNHPNVGLLEGNIGTCPNCGSTNGEKRGFRYTTSATYQRIQCKDCTAWYQLKLE